MLDLGLIFGNVGKGLVPMLFILLITILFGVGLWFYIDWLSFNKWVAVILDRTGKEDAKPYLRRAKRKFSKSKNIFEFIIKGEKNYTHQSPNPIGCYNAGQKTFVFFEKEGNDYTQVSLEKHKEKFTYIGEADYLWNTLMKKDLAKAYNNESPFLKFAQIIVPIVTLFICFLIVYVTLQFVGNQISQSTAAANNIASALNKLAEQKVMEGIAIPP